MGKALAQALAHRCLLAQQAEGANQELAGVRRPAPLEQAVVVEIKVGELALALGVRRAGLAARGGQGLRPGRVVGRGDQLAL